MQRRMHGCIICAPSGRPRRAGRRRRRRRLRSRRRRSGTRRSRSEGLSHPHSGEDTEAGVIVRPRGSWTPSRACSAPIVTPGRGGQGREDLLRRADSRLERDVVARMSPSAAAALEGAPAGSWRPRGRRGGSERDGEPSSRPCPIPGPGRGRAPPAGGPGAGAGPLRDLLMILLRVRPERGARRGLGRSGAARNRPIGNIPLPLQPILPKSQVRGILSRGGWGGGYRGGIGGVGGRGDLGGGEGSVTEGPPVSPP